MQHYQIDPQQLEKYNDVRVPEVEGMNKECFKKTFGFVMEMVVKKTEEMCKKTKCPVMGKWCQWARQNKNTQEAAFGMLMMKVQPWKF